MVKMNIVKESAKLIGKLGPAGLTLRKYAPEFLLGTGLLSFVGGTVLACRATLKLDGELRKRDEDIVVTQEPFFDTVTSDEEFSEIVNSAEYKKSLTSVYVKTGFRIVKLYVPASVAMVAAVACIIGSRNLQAGRIAGLSAAYSAAMTTLSDYRERVRGELGEEKELDIYRGIESSEIEVTKTLKNGKDKIVKEKVKTLNPGNRSMFTFIFDETNPEFTRNASYNKHFILSQEAYANAKYDLQGYMYLNDVLESLGFDTKDMPWTRVCGWVKGLGDDYIDFGVFEAYDPSKRDFVNGAEPAIWLDFNVDGYIFDKLGSTAPAFDDHLIEQRVMSELAAETDDADSERF